MPSISLLNKIQQCGVDLLKVLKILQKRGENATDLILMVDKIMYLQSNSVSSRRIRRCQRKG